MIRGRLDTGEDGGVSKGSGMSCNDVVSGMYSGMKV